MPALYTHARFGEAVIEYLPTPFAEKLRLHKQAFLLGTQGPDILFYHHPMKKNDVKAKGVFMHKQAGEVFFLQALKKLETYSDPLTCAEGAYVCGFLCHFTLDVVYHPYINANVTDTFTHGKIESELDKHFLRQDGKPVRGYNTASVISGENGAEKACSKFLEVPLKNVRTAIKSMRKINGWFSANCELFHSFAHTLLKIAGMERKFGDMFLHKKDAPRFQPLKAELNKLFQNAIPKAAALIQEYFNRQMTNEIYRCNYSGILEENK